MCGSGRHAPAHHIDPGVSSGRFFRTVEPERSNRRFVLDRSDRFCSAVRVTVVGSTIPASTTSTNLPVAGL